METLQVKPSPHKKESSAPQKLVRFDWAIKFLLKNKANFDILEGFLSELLKTDIKIESLLESESNKTHSHDKSNRVDLLVKTQNEDYIIVEVQCASEWDYLSRILYGTSKTITEFISQGKEYHEICKVISVNILFFNLGEGKDYIYHGETSFTGLHYHDQLKLRPEELKIYEPKQTPEDIFPEYYIIKVNQFNKRINDKFDEWIYFLKNERIEPSFNARGIQSAAQKLDVLRLSSDERKAYQFYQEEDMYENSMVLSHQISMEVAIEQALAQERAENEAKLAQERAERTKSEKNIKIMAARYMKKAGLSAAEIIGDTGLSEEEIGLL